MDLPLALELAAQGGEPRLVFGQLRRLPPLLAVKDLLVNKAEEDLRIGLQGRVLGQVVFHPDRFAVLPAAALVVQEPLDRGRQELPRAGGIPTRRTEALRFVHWFIPSFQAGGPRDRERA